MAEKKTTTVTSSFAEHNQEGQETLTLFQSLGVSLVVLLLLTLAETGSYVLL